MNYIELNNGIKMPKLGIGTFMLQPDDAENSVREALKIGYRLIDTPNYNVSNYSDLVFLDNDIKTIRID